MHGTSHHRFRYLAPFYDPFLKIVSFPFGGEGRIRGAIMELVGLREGERVLEVGCGTGTVTLLAAGKVGPAGEAVGIDPVPEMLGRARAKDAPRQARFLEGEGTPLPFPDGHFDAVIFFLVLHEMVHQDRIQALREAVRVLKPGGRLLVGELARPRSAAGRVLLAGLLVVEEQEAGDFLRRGLKSVIAEGTGGAVALEREVALAAGLLQGEVYRKVK
jgi:ubiquinone/menaquinone biosynthesis C-methylase UbiE